MKYSDLKYSDMKSLAKSYWTHCFKMTQEDMAFYIVGFSVYADQTEIRLAIDKLQDIPKWSRSVTINLNPGLVRDVLRDIVGAANQRATRELQEQAATWGLR